MTNNKPVKFRTTLTPKQKAFTKAYVKNNGNGAQAIKDSNYKVSSDNTASVMANENLRNPNIKKEIVKLMDKSGLDDKTLLRVHKEGLNSLTQNNTPDYSTRHRYLDTAYKLKGYTETNQQSNTNQMLQINFDKSFFNNNDKS